MTNVKTDQKTMSDKQLARELWHLFAVATKGGEPDLLDALAKARELLAAPAARPQLKSIVDAARRLHAANERRIEGTELPPASTTPALDALLNKMPAALGWAETKEAIRTAVAADQRAAVEAACKPLRERCERAEAVARSWVHAVEEINDGCPCGEIPNTLCRGVVVAIRELRERAEKAERELAAFHKAARADFDKINMQLREALGVGIFGEGVVKAACRAIRERDGLRAELAAARDELTAAKLERDEKPEAPQEPPASPTPAVDALFHPSLKDSDYLQAMHVGTWRGSIRAAFAADQRAAVEAACKPLRDKLAAVENQRDEIMAARTAAVRNANAHQERAEKAERELAAARDELTAVRLERDEKHKALRKIAHAVGVCHCADYVCEPGPTDAIVKQAEAGAQACGDVIDLTAQLEASAKCIAELRQLCGRAATVCLGENTVTLRDPDEFGRLIVELEREADDIPQPETKETGK